VGHDVQPRNLVKGLSKVQDVSVDSFLRIGELSRRTGASTHALRVWEDRYRLLSPQRSANGYRHYTAEDERRVRDMIRLRAQGVSAADSAARVLAGALERSRPRDLDALLHDLLTAFSSYDEARAHAVIDAGLVGHSLEEVLERLLFPCLRRLGDAWECGEVTVAQEHYASGLIRGRMTALGPELSRTARPGPEASRVAVLACTTHERHDIGLLGFDLLLRRDGWQVTFLGADTPVPTVVDLALDLGADLVVLCGTEPHMYAAQLEHHAAELATLPHRTTLALAGDGATREMATRYAATVLPSDPVRAARQMTARPARHAAGADLG
jgi:DNA-binding transcriptional MerR regulator/methylmalonyl-CoA mutase cobalamin-binding subunit